jgi:adenylate cyclase
MYRTSGASGFGSAINLGDVIAEGDDIFGDGVNVAARLEALAEPGGICISGTVRDHIRDKLPYPLADKGEQVVKNIALPVRVYALRPEAIAELPATSVPIVAARRWKATRITLAAATMAAFLILAAGAWWFWPATKTASTPAGPATASVAQAVPSPRLSIVVLPFANLSNDPDQQYFADGLTEDLTTDLSRIAHSFVISRNTAFTYRNKPVDTKQIGRELDVRYVLEGSVQRSGTRIRVTAQLIDAESDAHLWAEQFNRETGDLFALQNEITGQIALVLHCELIAAEATRPTERPDALEYILRGRAAYWKPVSREENEETIGFFERALALDPGSVEAQSELANMLASRVANGWSGSAEADLARAEGLVAKALTASPRSALAHYAKGAVLRTHGRCDEAIPEYEAVVSEAVRNWVYVNALTFLARCKFLGGSTEEVISLCQEVIRLSPRDPNIGIPFSLIGLVHLMASRTDEAILWFERARSSNPGAPFWHGYLASAYGLKGETERAAAELAEARRSSGDGRFSSIARLTAVGYAGSRSWGTPKVRSLFEATYFAGLRKAGMPEE